MSPQNYHIRPITMVDNAAVAKLIRDVMTEFGAVGEGYSINDPEVDDMTTAYASDNAIFYVLEHQGSIIGCGGIAPLKGENGSTCELQKMYFYPTARGKGLGKKMLEMCLAEAVRMGYQQCYLETLASMTAAGKLYQKMGFVPQQGAMGCTGHSSCDSFYVKQL